MLKNFIKSGLTKEQKLSAALLGVFVSAGMIMTVYGMLVRIQRPLLLTKAQVLNSVKDMKSVILIGTEGISITRDTDADGITDYDETNLYHTSPFLLDSDSDGVSDGDEVHRGTDPNCPEGKDCGGVSAQPVQLRPEDALQNLINPGAEILEATAQEQAGTSDSISPAEFLKSLRNNPTEMRSFLIKTGIQQSQLDKITNEQLVKLFDETLVKMGIK